jgi:hypothetical protein
MSRQIEGAVPAIDNSKAMARKKAKFSREDVLLAGTSLATHN